MTTAADPTLVAAIAELLSEQFAASRARQPQSKRIASAVAIVIVGGGRLVGVSHPDDLRFELMHVACTWVSRQPSEWTVRALVEALWQVCDSACGHMRCGWAPGPDRSCQHARGRGVRC